MLSVNKYVHIYDLILQEIPGLTDSTVPRRLGPKRASKIRKLFNLSKEDDVKQFVIKRPLPLKEGKTKQRFKAPKIQRLITPTVLQVIYIFYVMNIFHVYTNVYYISIDISNYTFSVKDIVLL